MNLAASTLTHGSIALICFAIAGAVHGMAPDVSKLAARTAEAAGCPVVRVEEDGLREGYLMFSITCENGASSTEGNVACKDGVCTFEPRHASRSNN